MGIFHIALIVACVLCAGFVFAALLRPSWGFALGAVYWLATGAFAFTLIN